MIALGRVEMYAERLNKRTLSYVYWTVHHCDS